jgi:pre-mRNA-processing factor 40
LQELVKEGIIVEGAKWKEIFPLISNDERFVNMLGQAGSTPLELFWDVVDALEIEFRLKRDYVLDVLDEKRYEVSELTAYDEFKSLMASDQRTSAIPSTLLQRIFANLVKKTQRHLSRSSRKKSDAFRSLLRHLPEIAYDSTWEQIRPLVEKTEEYISIDSEERLVVFDKVIRRLKEKRDEQRYRERSRHDDTPRRRYDESPRRSRERSAHRDSDRRHSRMAEIKYSDPDRKRRSSDDPREERKVHLLNRLIPATAQGGT